MANGARRPEHFVSLRDAMNQLFADSFTPLFQGQPGPGGAAPGDSLPVNVYEDGERYYLQLPLPGADPAAIDITAANGVLSISARQQFPVREGWRQVWQEFNPAEYRRQLRLPIEFDPNTIEASYENGLLLITVPKAEHTRPKQIKVQVGR